MKWFDNPRRRTGRKKRKAPKGGWKKHMAKLRAMRGRKRRSTPSTGGSMARRKRKSSKRRNAPRRRSRRSRSRSTVIVRSNPRRSRSVRRYRRRHNPRFSVRGLMNSAMQGAQDGLWIVGGKAVTNALPAMLGLSATGPLGIGIKALAAVGAGFVFGFVSPNAAKLATAAGFAAIYEPFVKGLNIPIISPALAADDGYDAFASYPEEVGTLAAYPQAVGVGADDDYAQQY